MKVRNVGVVMVPRTNDSSSSDSDDGDAEKMRHFLEAADTTLLTNTMFNPSLADRSSIEESKVDKVDDTASKQTVSKSNRFLAEEDLKCNVDFITTEAVRKHIAKKFQELLTSSVEFYDLKTLTVAQQKPWKSRVKLFTGAECYVKPYEEFEYESKGPTKRPDIKRRRVDVQENDCDQRQIYKMASVTADDVLTGKLTNGWVTKRERKDKVFCYKRDTLGNLHLVPEENEFTKMRKKNQWNESKIKQKRNKTT